MAKPELSLYLGQKVKAVLKGKEDWQWAIQLESGVEIRNKSRRETFAPDEASLKGLEFNTISYGMRDTTIHFGWTKKVSFPATQYVIHDPKHGGEVAPQWPEELEAAGVPSHPQEKVSDQPSPDWSAEERRLWNARQDRIQRSAEEFLRED